MDSTESGSKNGAKDESINSSTPGTSSLKQQNDNNLENATRFVLPGYSGSPSKVLTVNEIVNVINNIQKMELVHEIALNPDFKLQPYEPPENSLEKRVKDTMHKAFWDVLREQLNKDPPCYDHAMQLLNDIKECFHEIITSNNQRTLEHINEVLDVSVIKQQAEKGVLNFRSYADFIIQTMGKLCAPVRDEEIKKLSEIDDVVETFKGILETITVMKLDVANYLLEFAKKDLLANSIEYERKKFEEYLEYYKYGFPATESWLKRNQKHDENGIKSNPDETIYNAYMELLDWNNSNEFPEILNIDKNRLTKLSNECLRLCLSAAVMAICSGISIISQRSDNRISLANQIYILLQNVTLEMDLKEILESIWLQIKSTVSAELEKETQNPLDSTMENTIQAQILQLESKESPVRKLMWNRLKAYLRIILRPKCGLPPPPPGYNDFKDQLENTANIFRRIITYDYSVHGDYYVKILTDEQNNPSEAVAEGGGGEVAAAIHNNDDKTKEEMNENSTNE